MIEEKNIQNIKSDDEIDLIKLIIIIWEKRKYIIKVVLFFFILGLLVAFLSPKVYKSSTTFVLQPKTDGTSNLSNLSSLARFAGINIRNSSSNQIIAPTIYPQIISSIPYKLKLMYSKYNIKGIEEPITLFSYFVEYKKRNIFSVLKKYTIGLPDIFFKSKYLRDSSITKYGILKLSEDEQEIVEDIEDLISIDFNEEDGYITLKAEVYEANLSIIGPAVK